MRYNDILHNIAFTWIIKYGWIFQSASPHQHITPRDRTYSQQRCHHGTSLVADRDIVGVISCGPWSPLNVKDAEGYWTCHACLIYIAIIIDSDRAISKRQNTDPWGGGVTECGSLGGGLQNTDPWGGGYIIRILGGVTEYGSLGVLQNTDPWGGGGATEYVSLGGCYRMRILGGSRPSFGTDARLEGKIGPKTIAGRFKREIKKSGKKSKILRPLG